LRIRTERDRAVEEHQRSLEQLRESLEATVAAIAATVEMRDPYTAGHERRVADIATAIAREMQLPSERIEGIHFGALIHDLGKIKVPAELLSKPTRLTKAEFELVKEHALAGYDILKGIRFPWPVAELALQHHERMDGTGYPNGLRGDEMLVESKILAVADVVEAMASHRPYRPALGIEAALAEISAHRGTWYDSEAVDACVRLIKEERFTLSG
jgi:HD-GYP domain-containing protein (c-di-GMP phosphodiesterase class II)